MKYLLIFQHVLRVTDTSTHTHRRWTEIQRKTKEFETSFWEEKKTISFWYFFKVGELFFRAKNDNSIRISLETQKTKKSFWRPIFQFLFNFSRQKRKIGALKSFKVKKNRLFIFAVLNRRFVMKKNQNIYVHCCLCTHYILRGMFLSWGDSFHKYVCPSKCLSPIVIKTQERNKNHRD